MKNGIFFFGEIRLNPFQKLDKAGIADRLLQAFSRFAQGGTLLAV